MFRFNEIIEKIYIFNFNENKDGKTWDMENTVRSSK